MCVIVLLSENMILFIVVLGSVPRLSVRVLHPPEVLNRGRRSRLSRVGLTWSMVLLWATSFLLITLTVTCRVVAVACPFMWARST